MRKSLILLPVLLGLAACGIFRGGDNKNKTELAGDRLAVLAYEARTEADPELENLTVVLPAPVANAEWTQAGGSAEKALGHLAVGENLSRAWSVSIGDGSARTKRLTSAPVVADGRVYTMDTDAVVRAFRLSSGASIWSAGLKKSGEKSAIAFGGGVSAGAGRVFATSGYGLAAAFDAASGAELWRVDLGVPLRGAPGFDGSRVFVTTQDNQLLVLSVETGETVWESIGTVEPAGLLGAAAPAISRDTAVVGFSSGELIALRIENGRVVWQDMLSRTGSTTALASLSDIDAPAIIDKDRVYAIGHGGRMVGLDLATGQRVWERNLGGVAMPWVAGEFIFVVTLDAELVALTRSEGRVKWVSQLDRYRKAKKKKDPIIWRGPVLASDRLFLTNSQGKLVVASPFDGSVQQTINVGDKVFLPPVIADRTVLVLSENGRLSAYR